MGSLDLFADVARESGALESLSRHGLAIVPRALDLSAVDAAVAELDSFKRKNLDWLADKGLLVDGMLSRVVNLHLLLPSLRRLFWDMSPEAGAAADAIGHATLYTSLYFERGSEQSLHRDTPYFWTNPPYAYAGVWIALEDADEFNGALTAIPGSHLLGEPDVVSIRRAVLGEAESPPSNNALFSEYNARVLDRARESGLTPVSIPVSKGDAVFWNASTLHGGLPHVDLTRTRRSFVMHITTRGISVNHMQYFFHPEKMLPERAPWGYFEENGREFAAHGQVSFMHKFDCSLDRFDQDGRLVQVDGFSPSARPPAR